MKLDQYELGTLISIYNSGNTPNRTAANVKHLINIGMLRDDGTHITTTDKALIWLDQVLKTPLPEIQWVIPD